MRVMSLVFGLALVAAGIAGTRAALPGQEAPPPPAPAAAPAPAEGAPEVPKGVEVLARGPVHEAFASLAAEPAPTVAVSKQPPKPLEELPPTEKPEGNVVWISGYWAWDDERNDFLWVSGIWRNPPPGKQWVAGYWREQGDRWQWVPGFWSAAAAAEPEEAPREITYLPQPPATPATAPPAPPASPDTFFVPGSWVWTGSSYAWRAGYWARVQPGYVWVPDHYCWTPSGYVYVPGYWDYALAQRGILYAPVVVDPAVVTTSFYYTPAYAVSDTVVVDALFVRPAYAHYYFGDYYGPTYVALGFESGYVYSRRNYDCIVVYEGWAHRATPNWVGLQMDIYSGRSAGRLPTPPRTLVQQNINITNVTNVTNVHRTVTNYSTPVVAPAAQVAAAKGVKTVALDPATRQQARLQASAVQQVAQQRTRLETPLPPGSPRQARVGALTVPKAQPVHPGFVAPRAPQPSAATATGGMRAVYPTGSAGPHAGPAAPHTSPASAFQARPGFAPPYHPGTAQPGFGTGYRPGGGTAASIPPPHLPGGAPGRYPGNTVPTARPPARPAPPPPAHRPPPRDQHHREQ
jgi:hypothetical protein